MSLPRGATQLQDLVDEWHGQASLHYIDPSATWLFLQLERYERREGRICKNAQSIRLDSFSMPACRPGEAETALNFVPNAAILHQGATPFSGHYRVALLPSAGQDLPVLITNDGIQAAPLADCADVDLAEQAYVVLCQRR